jgi:hypothetical protein
MIWVAVFDIILDALSETEHETFYTRDSEGTVSATPDIAYADDLLSLQGSWKDFSESGYDVCSLRDTGLQNGH